MVIMIYDTQQANNNVICINIFTYGYEDVRFGTWKLNKSTCCLSDKISICSFFDEKTFLVCQYFWSTIIEEN